MSSLLSSSKRATMYSLCFNFCVLYLFISSTSPVVQGQTPCEQSEVNSVRINTDGVFVRSGGAAGRVEICQCTGKDSSCYWQTVSAGSLTAPFSWKNSIVVCRELDYFDVQSPILQNSVLETNLADDSVDIYPTTFVCDGSESKLIDCEKGEDTSGMTHEADAYVFCQSDPVDSKIRLVGSANPDEGVVEYYTSFNNLTWVTICPDFWRDSEANVVCRSLGYESGTAKLYPRSLFVDTAVESMFPIGGVTCNTRDELSFTNCALAPNQECANFDTLAGVVCTPDNGASEGSVRLYRVSIWDMYLRVEVFYGGRWGTVCDAGWELQSGEVACAELGNTRDLTQVGAQTVMVASSRPIWIRGYTCDGSESRLSDCPRPSFPIGYPTLSCLHANDAGLYCARAPHQLTGGEIAGIAISVITFVGIVVFVIVLEDKRKKGELQPWINRYRERRASFLQWYNHQRSRCRQCCCCCQRHRGGRSRQTRPSDQPLTVPTTSQQNATTSTSQSTTSSTSSPSTSGSEGEHNEPQMTGPSAPPSYNDALRHKHVVAPPPAYDFEEKKGLPYPDTPANYNPAYPPN